MTALRWFGAGYLLYLAYSAWTTGPAQTTTGTASLARAFWRGFVTNALNPKTMIFVLSLFMQVIEPGTAWPVQVGYGAIIVLAHVLWFGLVALFFSTPAIASQLVAYKRRIDQLFGAALVGFGLLLSALSLKP